MLKPKKKNKNIEKDEFPVVEKDIKNPHLVKVWDKEDYINRKLSARPLEFYIRNYRVHMNIGLVLSFTALLLIFLSGFIIENKKAAHNYYITSTDGRVLEHNLSPEDVQNIRKAFKEISQRNNR